MRAQFAKNLALLRQNAGISQRTAAAELQVSQALLSHYEKGIREPGLDFVVRAAEYYGVSTDVLLGCQPPTRQPQHAQPGSVGLLNPYAREVQQDLWDTMGILLDALDRNYDPDVFCFASIYLAETFYELIRYYSRLTDNYAPDFFHLDEKSFSAGAVNSDMAWVRSQYLMALHHFKERQGLLPGLTPEELQERYGDALPSLLRLLRLVGCRVARQDAAESQISGELFGPRLPGSRIRSIPKEEENK